MTPPSGGPHPRRGEVWTVNFDPTKGAEIGKTRPVLVISADGVGRLPLRIVVPITNWRSSFAQSHSFTHIQPNAANGLTKPSGADAFQVKSVSLDRFDQKLGILSGTLVDEVANGVAFCIGL